jgi:hypothetical protein
MQLGTRPDAVVIRLMIESTQAFSRRRDIANQDRQRPRQWPTGVSTQNALQRDDAAVFVAVQQHGNQERSLASSGQMDQGRTAQQAMQFTGRGFEKARSGRDSSTVSMKWDSYRPLMHRHETALMLKIIGGKPEEILVLR